MRRIVLSVVSAIVIVLFGAPAVAQNAAKGERLFDRPLGFGCATCHTVEAGGKDMEGATN